MTSSESLQSGLSRSRQIAWALGVIGLALCAVEYFIRPTQFFRSYLLGVVFWIGIGLASLGILMLQHLVAGRWGFVLRRLLESAAKTIVWMAILFIPVLLGVRRLYMWAQPAVVAADPMLQYKHPYLNVPFFIARTVFYFAAWILLGFMLTKWSTQQDETGEPELIKKMRNLSGPGMVIYGFTVSWAGIDWIMSLEPHWFSTIYGMMFVITEAVGAMAFLTIVARLLSEHEPMSKVLVPDRFHDFGNLLLVFTILWAYLSFAQFLIIWAGNLQNEIPWYVVRANGGWAWVALFLIVFHFGVPFLLLLQRVVTYQKRLLSIAAALLFVVSIVDLFWLMVPAYDKTGPHFHWADWVAIVGVGGIWVALFLSQLKSRPLLPLNDPRFQGVLQHE
ncbi:MAG TPA: hypothetical protein VMX16_01990 [Terriglobia bacterium]|nr:hypothetical protein [Terriglobia bacterium]